MLFDTQTETEKLIPVFFLFYPLELTHEQRSKFTDQKNQYEDGKAKLSNQLLKLKEQREALKDEGAKHEDVIMKENARLQVKVKGFLICMQK